MLFRLIYDDKLAAAAYLIGCQRSGECVIVDPLRDVDTYTERAKREGMRIAAVAETHIHADFLSGTRELAARTKADVYLSAAGAPDWNYRWTCPKQHFLRDGEGFRVGNIELVALHTPGHTPEHICLLVTDHGGGVNEPMGILSGDFLFVGDVGRPDLLESAAGQVGAADASARMLYQSLHKLRGLPDWLQVWPAHGAGSACGKALGAVPQSTVGYEARFNPALLLLGKGEEDFAREIVESQPEPPLYFARMKRLNRDGVPPLLELPKPAKLSAAELAALDTSKIAVIDTRPWDTFRTGHLRGALFFPQNNSFTTDVGSLVSDSEEIVLVVPGARLEEAVRDLVRIGLDKVTGWCEPATLDELARSGARLAESRQVAAPEAQAMVNAGAFVLDVRRAAENAQVRINGALNMAHTRMLTRLEDVPRDRELLVHCHSGARSARACALLERRGYDPVNLAGGIVAWEKAGGKVSR